MEFWHQFRIKNVHVVFFFMIVGSVAFGYPSIEGIQIYQKNMHLSPEHKQNLADDIKRYRQADDIWNVLRQQFTLPHYENSPTVQAKIQWFLNHQDDLTRSMARAAPYLYFILQQIKKRHLPAELALLPIIESSYNPFALNASSGAAGIWQMMPGTASGYGIRQNGWYDGRRDVVTSTKAALNHLAYLQSFFEGNWLLAIAAYDTGEGNVLSAIRKNINLGENTDFWSLPLAQETRDYVPQLLALAIIISHPEEYPIEFPPVRNAPYLAQVDIGGQLDLKEAAYLAGLSVKDLKRLNSGYSRSAMDPNGPFKLVLPIESVEQFTENLASTSFSERVKWSNVRTRPDDVIKTIATHSTTKKTAVAHKSDYQSDFLTIKTVSHAFENSNSNTRYSMQPGDTLYMVRSGDDLEKIARHFHISANLLAMVNQTHKHAVLRPGQEIIIPTHPSDPANSEKYTLTPGDTIYMVRHGDTIEKIANKFHTTPAALRLTNLLAGNTLEEGDQLVIPTHV